MEDQANQRAAWTIKSVDVEVRKLAVACALKTGETMAQWIARAVRNQAGLETGTSVMPPAAPPASRALAVASRAAAPMPVIDMAGLSSLLATVQALAAASGTPIPRGTTRHALALVRDQLRAARGLPVSPVRSPKAKSGQTLSEEQED